MGMTRKMNLSQILFLVISKCPPAITGGSFCVNVNWMN